jgi:hypothetical protein
LSLELGWLSIGTEASVAGAFVWAFRIGALGFEVGSLWLQPATTMGTRAKNTKIGLLKFLLLSPVHVESALTGAFLGCRF